MSFICASIILKIIFSVADLNAIQWLSINQNPGISADNLNAIMAKLVNLERLSLNSNALWKLNSDTFTFNAKLKSVSLHNNAISCLDGVFDNLIDNVSTAFQHFSIHDTSECNYFNSEHSKAIEINPEYKHQRWMECRISI